MKNPFLLFFLFLSIIKNVIAQDSIQVNSSSTHFLIQGTASNYPLPFWLRVNQYATAPKSSGISIYAAHARNYVLKNPHWQVGGKINGVINLASKNQILLPEFYGKVQYKKWEFYTGRRKEVFGLADSILGTGSYIWSGNALPIPKIQVGIIDYIPLKFTRELVAIKGNYAHGWFGSWQFAYGVMLHQKSLYLKIGKPHWITNFYGGFSHQVQWGGRTYVDFPTVVNRHLPSKFTDYLFAVTGSGGLIGPSGGGNNFDSTNRVGNHLGTLDMGITVELPKLNIFLYRQNIYEDGSLYYLTNITDGLNGLTIKRVNVLKEKNKLNIGGVNFEFLDTRSQGGPTAGNGSSVWGKDNYFNHQQYYDGWTYRGTIIGTPFLTRQADTKRQEIFNSNEATNNNRVWVFHIGTFGYFGNHTEWISKFSWSRNFGTYDFPYPAVKQFSGLIKLAGYINWLEGIDWTAAIAWDKGQLYQNSFGIQVGLRKVWYKRKYSSIAPSLPSD